MLAKIKKYIRKHKLSTTEIADAMNKSGVLSGVHALNRGHHKVGHIYPVFAANGSNYSVHEQIVSAPAGCIVVIFVENCDERAIIGELMVRQMLLYSHVNAIVVCGLVRDAARLYQNNSAVWAKGVTPLGCVNTPMQPFDEARMTELKSRYIGGIATCDDGGVVLIPRAWVNEDMLERLERIEIQENLWEFCLNSLKWDTWKIVSEKAYFTSSNSLPVTLRKNLDKLKRGFAT